MTEEQLQQKHERMGLDCYVAVAIIGGVAAVAGGAISAVGANSAADTQAAAANNASNLQQQQYQQNRQDQQPYMQAGTTALNQIGQDQANGTGFAKPFNFQADPGYGFQLQQGQTAINNSAAAQSGVLNGGTLKALDQYTTGLANTTYGDAYNRYLQTSQQKYNQLFNVASLGENATANTGAAGTQSANNAGNYLTQAGNAQAAGDIGVGNAINSGLGGLASIGYGAYQQSKTSQSGYGIPGASGFGSSPTNLSGLINPGSYSHP